MSVPLAKPYSAKSIQACFCAKWPKKLAVLRDFTLFLPDCITNL